MAGAFVRQVAGVVVVEPDVLADELEAVPESALAAGLSAAAGADEAAAGADVPPLPLRKSVTYQPVPLSWKPAAVNCFLKVLLAQDGQSVSGASDTFCNTSLAKPQDSQR